jgi:hypothetical protein
MKDEGWGMKKAEGRRQKGKDGAGLTHFAS